MHIKRSKPLWIPGRLPPARAFYALIGQSTRRHMTPRAARCNSGRYARFDIGATRCRTPFRGHKKHQAGNETLPSGGAEAPVAISLGLSFWPEVVQVTQVIQTTVHLAMTESPLPVLTMCLECQHPKLSHILCSFYVLVQPFRQT